MTRSARLVLGIVLLTGAVGSQTVTGQSPSTEPLQPTVTTLCVDVVADPGVLMTDPELFADALANGELSIERIAPCPEPLPTADPSASPTAAATLEPEQAITFKGRSAKSTKPFELEGGDYEVLMKVRGGTGSDNCAREGLVTAYLILSGEEFGEEVEQDSYIYDVEPGRYHWDVSTVPWCSWTITIKPSA